jgi:hypothetical protein
LAKLPIRDNRTLIEAPLEPHLFDEAFLETKLKTILTIAVVSGRQAAESLKTRNWKADESFYKQWLDKIRPLKEECPTLYYAATGAFYLSVGNKLLLTRSDLPEQQVKNAYQACGLAQRYLTNAFIHLDIDQWTTLQQIFSDHSFDWRQQWVSATTGTQAVVMLIKPLWSQGWICYRATLKDDLIRKIDLIAQPENRTNGGICFQVKSLSGRGSQFHIVKGGSARLKPYTFSSGIREFGKIFRGSWVGVNTKINTSPSTQEGTHTRVVLPVSDHFHSHY